MEITLSRIIKDWFDDHEFRNEFIPEYPGRDSLIIRHPASNKMIMIIFNQEIILAYFHNPVCLNATDPHLFHKLDQALRQFVDRI